jgi:endonuclease YncB( thermonuclease family)
MRRRLGGGRRAAATFGASNPFENPKETLAMARSALANAGGVPFLTLKGTFVVRGAQQPDGDTIAFSSSRPYSAGPVRTNVPVDTTGKKTTNLRLQSIDAPEKSQPLGAQSRDFLLEFLGFDPVDLGLGDDDFKADGPPRKRTGWLATHEMDGNGRPLSYVFAENPGFRHGEIVSAAEVEAVLKSSANYASVAKGWSFPAFYENSDELHAYLFRAVAEAARAAKRGVWAVDRTTTGFVPTPAALGAGGTLVYPKFYRRVLKWKQAKPKGSAFIAWLKKQADGKKLVQGAKPVPVPLAELFEKVGSSQVRVPYDVTRLWFSE